MVEIPAAGTLAIPHTLRDAGIRSVADLSAELRRVKTAPLASPSARWADRYARWATRVPGMIQGVYAIMVRSARSRQQIGTVAVTSVGMFAAGVGYARWPAATAARTGPRWAPVPPPGWTVLRPRSAWTTTSC
jgi:hypothetical protein